MRGGGSLLSGIGLGIAAFAANLAAAFLLVWIYSIAVAPGHDGAFYQAFANRVAPAASIIFGLFILFGAGWLAARRAPGLIVALVPAFAYIALDAALTLALAPRPGAGWALLLTSWLTKLAAAWAGGRLARRPAA